MNIPFTRPGFLPALSVIRMIKLFGWERSMHDKISEQREEELLWIWRGEVLDVVSTIVKCALFFPRFLRRALF